MRSPPGGEREPNRDDCTSNFEGDAVQVKVPALNVQQANLQSIDLGTVSIGPITVGDLVLSNTDFSMAAAKIVLQSVSVSMSIHFILDWAIHIGMPDWALDSASIAHLHGNPITIPTFSANTLSLPSAQIPQVTSSAPLDIPAQLSDFPIGFDGGLLVVTLHVIPFARMHVDHLDITDANASATVGTIVLHNVTLPYDVLNLTLSQIGISSIGIPSFNVS